MAVVARGAGKPKQHATHRRGARWQRDAVGGAVDVVVDVIDRGRLVLNRQQRGRDSA